MGVEYNQWDLRRSKIAYEIHLKFFHTIYLARLKCSSVERETGFTPQASAYISTEKLTIVIFFIVLAKQSAQTYVGCWMVDRTQ